MTRVAIGWDRPLRTYYVQLFGPPDADGEDTVLLWVGTEPGELVTATAALALVAPHAVVPDDLPGRLEADRRDGHDRRDGPVQAASRGLLRRLRETGRGGGSDG